MTQFFAQLKRELWEHPALYAAPAGIAALSILLVAATMLGGFGADGGVRIALDGLDMSDRGIAAAGVTGALLAFLPAFMLPLLVIVTFYLLDSLSAERRDRSILFFKSLPVSDVMTVAAKLATALFVAPGIAVAALLLTQTFALVLASAAMADVDGGLALLWNPNRLSSIGVFAGYSAVAFAVWYAPWFCYLAAVSAWARRATLLWASAPLLLMFIERALTGTSLLARLFAAHINGFWVNAYQDNFRFAAGSQETQNLLEPGNVERMASVWGWMSPVALLTSPLLWAGLVVALALASAAVIVRRYRDDS
jgi:ABC-2 type transport system permease protein